MTDSMRALFIASQLPTQRSDYQDEAASIIRSLIADVVMYREAADVHRNKRLENLEELVVLRETSRAGRRDTNRLDFLESKATPPLGWLCRDSSSGRGYRLHQGSGYTATTAREAIDDARLQDKTGGES